MAPCTSYLNNTSLDTLLGTSNITLDASGFIGVKAPVTWTSGYSLTLDAGTNISIRAPINGGASGSLSLTSGDAISQNAAGILTIGGTSSFTTSATGGTITLNSANLLTGAVSLNTGTSGGATSLTNGQATVLDVSNVGGSLTVSSAGNLTQTATGILTVGGTSSFTTSVSGAAITLTNANLLTGAVSLNTSGASGNASLTNNLPTQLDTSTVGGNLTVTDQTGALTQTAGILTVGGNSVFNNTDATAAGTITLNSANLLSGTVALNTAGSNAASLTNNLPTQLDTSNVGGNLTVTDQTGALTQTAGILTVGGNSVFNNTDATAAGTITLNSANLLSGTVALNTAGSNAASLTNNLPTQLDTSNVGGDLTVTDQTGALTQTAGILTVGGNSVFNNTDATAAGTITLNSANLLSGTVALNTAGSNAASLTNNLPTQLDTSNVGGDLTVTDSTGSLTQTAGF